MHIVFNKTWIDFEKGAVLNKQISLFCLVLLLPYSVNLSATDGHFKFNNN